MPDYNPYTIRRCRDCDIAKRKTSLAFVSDNDLCKACKFLRATLDTTGKKRANPTQFASLCDIISDWAESHLPRYHVPNVPNTNSKRAYSASKDGHVIGIGKKFFSEMMAKNKRNPLLPELVEASKSFSQWIPNARLLKHENGNHHSFGFNVYTVSWNGRVIEFKCKLTDGELLYNMRFI